MLENVWKRRRGGEDVVNVTYKRVKILFFTSFALFLFSVSFFFLRKDNNFTKRKIYAFFVSSSFLIFEIPVRKNEIPN